MSLMSLAILALLTLSRYVFRLWTNPVLLEQVNIPHPKRFVVQYGVGFTCAKVAMLLFMTQSHLPDMSLLGFSCTNDPIPFQPTTDDVYTKIIDGGYTDGGVVHCSISNSTRVQLPECPPDG